MTSYVVLKKLDPDDERKFAEAIKEAFDSSIPVWVQLPGAFESNGGQRAAIRQAAVGEDGVSPDTYVGVPVTSFRPRAVGVKTQMTIT